MFVSAWGHSGPWADRRGFDSVVQAPTGIAWKESADGTQPGASCPVNSWTTGPDTSPPWPRSTASAAKHSRAARIFAVCLSRSYSELAHVGIPADHDIERVPDGRPVPRLQQLSERGQTITGVQPPGQIDDVPVRWSHAGRYGDDDPSWPSR